MPIFIFLKEQKSQNKYKLFELIKIGYSRIKDTLKNIKTHKNIGIFLLAFYFMSDALVTLFSFMAIYARDTIKLSVSEITIALFLVQIIGFPSAVLFGYLSDKKGAKKYY